MYIHLNKESALNKDSAIIQHYRDLIRQNHLQPNDLLPTENEMCALFGASRMTVRKALDRMVSQGWVYRISGTGTFVAPGAFHRVFTVQGFSRYMGDKGYRVESVVLEMARVHPAAHIARLLGLGEDGEAWHLVRSRAADGHVLAIESVLLDAGRFPDLDRQTFDTESLYQDIKNDYNLEVVSSSQKINTTRIEGPYARLLFGAEQGVALQATNLGYAKNAVLVEYDEALYNGYEFSIDILVRKEWGE